MSSLVSIVVPTYNQELYLDRSITSLIKQSYSNIEILAVNDGSTDKSLAIIQAYAEKDNRIKAISEENGGLVQATITGVTAANGEYICFCDPDDYVGENFVSTFINHIGTADFIACGFFTDRNGDISEAPLNKDKYYSVNDIHRLQHSFILENHKCAVSKEIYVSRWNKMYKTTCIKNIMNDYRQCLDASLGEDSIFTYLMLKHSSSGVSVKSPNSYYYNTKSQTSMMGHTDKTRHLEKSLNAYQHLLKLEDKYGDRKCSQAYALYFFLIESVFQKLKGECGSFSVNTE